MKQILYKRNILTIVIRIIIRHIDKHKQIIYTEDGVYTEDRVKHSLKLDCGSVAVAIIVIISLFTAI